MNSILFYEFNQLITGSTINMFEYFLSAYEYNKDIKLVIVNVSKPTLKKFLKIIEDRYILDGIEDFKQNIICIKRSKLVTIEFDTVLVLDYNTINKTKGILRAKNIIVISEKYTDKFYYDTCKYNVTMYGEMPFHYKDINYRMKCLFDRFKPLKNVKVGTYINSPKNDEDLSWTSEKLDIPLPVIYKSKVSHENNLFEQFTTYLYYHANKWFDPHPRLFLECKFYDKDIVYLNPYKIMDGSWFRYIDICERGVEDRTLNQNDEIIRQLI